MSESFATTLLWVIPVAPLVAVILTPLLGGRGIGKTLMASEGAGEVSAGSGGHWPCVVALALSCAAALALLFGGVGSERFVASGYEWIGIGGFDIVVNLRIDALTAIMLATVNFVSLLVAIYSIGYMHGDPGYHRYFSEISLFVFSMNMLVLAQNLLVLYVFWEGVSICSYLLIGFWHEKPVAAAAAKKAFLLNRIGDFAFLIGIFLTWHNFGTLELPVVLSEPAIAHLAASENGHLVIVSICFLLFVGAVSKSAQFPLHLWLPDAMEGPTPVSALIHAATMVTAGVYLVARCTPLYRHAPEAQLTMAGIGAFTAILAGLIALTQNDLKRVLAYSTVSQLGYMFLALGAAVGGATIATLAVTAAIFHLFTHAFFKALLFLGAGSVMHAMGGEIDMREFGGLRRRLPITHITFVCAAAALSGAPLLAGFWSKDEILSIVARGTEAGPYTGYFLILLVTGSVTAILTAFYIFRAYFLTFWGAERFPEAAGDSAHESPPVMTVPMVVLAAFAVLAGLVVGPTGWFASYLEQTPSLLPTEAHGLNWTIAAEGIVGALIGFGIALVIYQLVRTLPEQLRRGSGPLYALSNNRFYLDEIFSTILIIPLRGFGWLADRLDRHLIDRLVDLIGFSPRLLAYAMRPLQNGFAPSYALWMFGGLTVLVLALISF